METENQTTTSQTASQGKTIAIIAYITIIGLIVAFVMNNEKKDTYASYHIKQSLGLGLSGLAFFIIGIIPILGWLISFLGSFLIIFLWIMGLINAVNNKEQPVPLLGKKFEQWFKNIN